VATDVGQHQMWVMQYYPFGNPRTLLTSGGLGTMGYGMGAAIGGCFANNKERTVLFTSDGSFGMNLTELATAVTQELPLVIVLLNNGVLGMVRQWQSMFFGERYSQTILDRKTDFPALARAFGACGHTASSLSELEDVLKDLPEKTPVLIDCRIDKDEKVLPMIPPGGTLKDIVVRR
jgi:acetolactate synthase-1/2/3 large subunit